MNINDLDLETGQVPGTTFLFSGARPDDIIVSDPTLATIMVDVSGSVSGFADDLVTMLNTAVDALKKSPRAENILVRVGRFADDVVEVHGFAPLSSIGAYTRADLPCGGSTALIDAALSGVGAMNAYGKKLVDLKYSVNGIMFVITDGDENASVVKDPARIKAEIDRAVRGETVKGITTILVGINASRYEQSLKALQAAAGIGSYVAVTDATPQRLAKFAGLVSKSVSSASKNLAQGQAAVVIDPADLTI